MNSAKPVVLTIAGSDSGGGAGIQADLRTFSARDVFGTTAITCLTAQNPDSVTDVSPVKPDFLSEQILQVDRFFTLQAVKTGMLFSADLVQEVIKFLKERPKLPAVIDPVMVATSGAVLLDPKTADLLREELLPLATVFTPNLDEAKIFLGEAPKNAREMNSAALELAKKIGAPVLLKGGHLKGELVTDVLADPGGEIHVFTDSRIMDVNTHGSGCTLAAAIASELAKGAILADAVATSRHYLRTAMQNSIQVGKQSFINHSVDTKFVAAPK